MKKTVLFLIVCSISFSVFSQKKDRVLLLLNGKSIKVSEFKSVYEKNLDVLESDDEKNVRNNLDLFINYKLKVEEAYSLQLDTLRSYKRELETYKNQLIAPYLQDKEFLNKLVKEAYFRTKNEIRGSHILVRIPRGATPEDTLKAYTKISAARAEIIAGASFKEVALKTSEDPSVKKNGGDLGYFSAFKMVYAFEDAAYKTKIGEVSQSFKTRFGYHIVQINALRESAGEIEVAHILITDTSNLGKKKIDTVYQKLQKGNSFAALAKIYSNDSGSKKKGGKLRKFGAGRMVKPFEEAAFSLSKEDNYSAPFKTRFGWHIVQLIKKHPVASFELMKASIKSKIKGSSRASLSDDAVLNKLKEKYDVVAYEESKEIIKRANFRAIPIDSLQGTILSINGKKISQETFVDYARNRRHKTASILFEMFTDEEILKYYKENLRYTEPAYATTLKEYEDGLLLFELMQQKIWNKSSKDSLGLKKYFTGHKSNYKGKQLSQVKGEVMNDYQLFLEEEWIATLRKKSKIKIKKRQLKKLIKFYRNKK